MRRVLDDLRAAVGEEGIEMRPDVMHPLLTDERANFHGRALAIVRPRTTAALAAAARTCYAAGVGMVPQGGNTGYCGGATPDTSGGQVLFNLSRMNRIRNVDANGYTLTAEAGVLLADAQAAAAGQARLLPLSMGSEGSCQLGGVVSTNAGGLAVLRYGTARDLVAGLEVVLPDGRIWSDLAGLRKDNTGYDLKQLFVGAEGTLGFVTGVVMRLFPAPRRHVTAWLAIDGAADALTVLAALRARFGDTVTSAEFVARDALGFVLEAIDGVGNPLAGHAGDFALVELSSFDDDEVFADAVSDVLAALADDTVIADAVVASSERQRRAFWRLREAIPEAEKRAGRSVKHDVSVPLASLGAFARALENETRAAFPEARLSVYGHVGDGNLHFNVLAPAGADPVAFRARHAASISALVHRRAAEWNGSFSAEHGVGQLKRNVLRETAAPVALELMQALKRALDPKGLMNPGKVL